MRVLHCVSVIFARLICTCLFDTYLKFSSAGLQAQSGELPLAKGIIYLNFLSTGSVFEDQKSDLRLNYPRT